ncbi:MAG: hypothetical protein RL063_14 [Pseudomonadota bacterium]
MRMLMMFVVRVQRVLINICHCTNANRKALEAK